MLQCPTPRTPSRGRKLTHDRSLGTALRAYYRGAGADDRYNIQQRLHKQLIVKSI
jgi:hypothetical protein